MRFNIADSHVSALLLSGQIGDAADVAERVQQQAADLPGAARSPVLPWRVGPPLVQATCIPRVRCENRQR